MKLKYFIFTALFFVLMSCSVLAENNVSSIDIDVSVRDDGSAYVTQVWNGHFDSGTENYIPINTDGIEITDFSVSDIDGEYTYVDDWNIDANFDDKSRKCGINTTDDGIELCFGISEYGENRYAIEYIIHGFIGSYTDYDGTNFMFINPSMSTFPTDGKISVALQNGTSLSAENSGIWGFGFVGQVEFQDGRAVAYTSEALSDDNKMIFMLRLDKNIIYPEKTVDGSFADVIDLAMEDSDYGTEDEEVNFEDFGILEYTIFALFLLVPLLIIGLIAALIVSSIKRRIAIKQFYKDSEYFREIPNGGSLTLSNYLARSFNITSDESLIIGAALMSMINKGNITSFTEESVGFAGRIKEKTCLKLSGAPENGAEKRLFDILLAACGDDGILQEKELSKYAEKHPEKLRGFINNTYTLGENQFKKGGGYFGKQKNHIKYLSEVGKKELSELMGLKKFLLDFSLISERGIAEVTIWQDYLVYATLLDIADEVLKQMKKVYPDKIAEIEVYTSNVYIAHTLYTSMYRATASAEAARSSGGGGASSLGGGGGFSGGGVGGGSR